MKFSKDFILKSTKGETIWNQSSLAANSVNIDSRRTKPGELFIAIKGENFDGHDFVKEAFEKGASAAIVEEMPSNLDSQEDKLLIKVESTEKALTDLAKKLRKSKKTLQLAAITGSNGKTTTKEMTYSILSVNNNVLKNSGNFNNNIGLPLTLLNLNDDHNLCVVELGMNNFGEIEHLTEIAEPDVGAITNIGRAHLENLGSVQGVAKAKGELVQKFTDKNIFCVNIDDPYIVSIAEEIECKKITYSLNSKNADIYSSDIRRDGFKSLIFNINIHNQFRSVRIRGIGEHNVLNSLCASAVAYSLGCTIEEIQAGLERYSPSQMRLEVIESPFGFTILNDSYNANPDSMIKGIDELVIHKNNNKVIAVLGDMLELGENSDSEHKKIGKYLSASKVDKVIAIGEKAKFIVEGLNGSNNGLHVKSHEEASEILKDIAQPQDVVLIKGSRGMRMENVIQNLYKV